MNDRLQASVYLFVLVLIIGWLLYIGSSVFLPIVFSIIVVYVIVGSVRMLGRIPVVGQALPVSVCYAISILLLAGGIFLAVNLVAANKDALLALAPRYQESVLTQLHKGALLLRIDTEPTWDSIRRGFVAQFNIQSLIATTVASLSGFMVKVFVVALYACFLLIERRRFADKLAAMAPNAQSAARISSVIDDINDRIGTYLALKTLLGLVQGVLCWGVMKLMGLELAELWAVLIALLNYIPYIGSVLGVLFPSVMALVQFGQSGELLALLIALMAIHFVVGNVLDPYLMGNSLNLSPFAILAGMAIWSAIWGVAGAFLAVPIMVSMTIICSQFPMTRPIAVLLSKNGRLSTGVNLPAL
jgi:predicted PurR-regulated permease PerM